MPHLKLKVSNALVLAAVVIAAAPAAAQVQRPMTVVDLIGLPSISDPQIAPNGKHIAYVQAEADWKADKRISQIWRVNIDGSSPMRLTAGTESAMTPRWSPDGKSLAFVTKRGDDGASQVLRPRPRLGARLSEGLHVPALPGHALSQWARVG